jgi:hypothetical protein
MATKKPAAPKPLTELEQLKSSVSILEAALYQAFADYDELQTMIIMFREASKGENFSKYWVHDYCQAMLTNAIANQHNMMDCAGLKDY